MARIISAMDKIGVGGVVLAALSCTACFPALGALAATLGLGFLSQLEGIAINTLLPLFAVVALVVNGYGWYQHRVHWRGLLALLGIELRGNCPTVPLPRVYYLQPSDAKILVVGPRLESHSVIFLAIQTHLS